MTENSPLSANPAHYPVGGTFADFIRWHMDYWGTRPTGSKTVNGIPWTKDEFRQTAFGSNWQKDTFTVGLRNWRGAGSAPAGETATTIINTFFGTNPVFAQWRNDFEEAYKNSKGPGKNLRSRTFPDPPPIQTATASLPRLTPYFMGRDDECDKIVEAILSGDGTQRAFLIQGGPGMGKTELSKAVAHHKAVVERFGSRRWFVRLETVTTTDMMQQAMAREFGCDSKQGFQAVLDYLSAQRSFVILDNLETPWESGDERQATEEVLAELAAIAGLTLIASFRGVEKVGGPRWVEHRIPEFSRAKAVELFESICGSWVRRDPYLPCFITELGGVPLAISLVARRAYGRTTLISLWQEWQRIGARLAKDIKLTSSRITSLPYSIELSLLSTRMSPDAELLFRLLGQLPDGLTHYDIQTYLGDDHLLAEETLLAVGLAIETPNRIDLLPPIRDYARRYYPPDGIYAKAWPDNILFLAGYVGTGAETSEDDPLFLRLQGDLNNIEAAFQKCLMTQGDYNWVRLSIMGYKNLLIAASKRSNIFSQFAERFEKDGNRIAEGICLKMCGDIFFHFSEYDIAKDKYIDALEIFNQEENITFQANTLASLGDIENFYKRFENSEELYLDARSRFRQIGDKLGEANSISRLGRIAVNQEFFEKARELHNEALAIYEKIDTTHGVAISWLSIGYINMILQDYESAENNIDCARSRFIVIGDTRSQSTCLRYLGDIALAQNDLIKSEKYYRRIITPYAQLSWKENLIHALIQLGVIELHKENYDISENHWSNAIEMIGNNNLVQKADFLIYIALNIVTHAGADMASTKYEQALTIFEKLGDTKGIEKCQTFLHSLKASR